MDESKRFGLYMGRVFLKNMVDFSSLNSSLVYLNFNRLKGSKVVATSVQPRFSMFFRTSNFPIFLNIGPIQGFSSLQAR